MEKKRGKGIIHVSNLFKKYTDSLRAPQGAIIQTFISIVEETLNLTVKKEVCTYNTTTKTLSIHTSGMLKTEIILYKKKIITKLEERLGKKSAPKEII